MPHTLLKTNMVRSSHLCSKNEKKFSDVTWAVIPGFKNADLGGQNEFQTKMGNFDAVFFIPTVRIWQSVILTIWTFSNTKNNIL